MTFLSSLSRRTLMILAGLGAAGLFFGALGFQYIGGLDPCAMCFWQRWPHRVGIALGLIGAFAPLMIVAWAGALTMAVSVGLAAFHTGVERHWWDGPATCTSRGLDLINADCGLLDPNCGNAIVMCDEIPWQLFGLSMANYNVLASLVLMAIWIMAARRA